MKQYNVTGMSCAACQARVEKAVSSLTNVKSCSVSLLTNSMGVEGDVDDAEVIKAVVDAGYGASRKGAAGQASAGLGSASSSQSGASGNYDDELTDTETPKLKARLIASLILLIPLMYVSMGYMMWNWPLPDVLAKNHLAIGIYELILSGLIMVINQKFFISGFRGLIHKSPNMDTLVALGATSSFVYSVYALFAMSGQIMNMVMTPNASMDMSMAMKYMDEFYFESAGTILTLITVGKMLEARAKGKTTDALKSLMKLAPKTATILINNVPTSVPISQVKLGDIAVIKPGESIPVDARVIKGNSAVNESALTGESIPVDKEIGDMVYAATINQSGYIECEATRVGEDTTISQIIQMVSDAAATKAPIAKIADRVSGVFVPIVIGIAVVTFVIWMICGGDFGFSLARAISVLVISCPCALGLATPVAIMVGNGVGAKNSILFKTASSLEETGKINIIALDKTGTITKGEPEVRDIIPLNGYNEENLLIDAYSLEYNSEHPLAKAIVNKANSLAITKKEVSSFTVNPGNGLMAVINGSEIAGGNMKYISSFATITSDEENLVNKLASEGKTPLLFAKDNKLIGIIAVADVIKDDSAEAIKELKDLGLKVVMLTGDNSRTAAAIGTESGVDEIISDVLPSGKEAVIADLMNQGKVAMVGDGINDAPALTRANIGIAIGAGTDVAIDAADIVLMKNSLRDVAAAIRISRATLKNIHENLFWAFFYNIIGIPFAAGVWIPLFGWTLTPMFGAAAMSLSSFCVVSNALRLNMIKPYGNSALKNKTISNTNERQIKEKENKNMVIEVKGMMCPHCEAHTKQALEALDGVVSAVADHNTATVTIETSGDVSEEAIKVAVEGAGYEYVGIK